MSSTLTFKPSELLPTLLAYREKLDTLSTILSKVTQRVGNWVNSGQGNQFKELSEFHEGQRSLAEQLIRKDLSINLTSSEFSKTELSTAELILSTYKNGAQGHRRYEIMENLFKSLELGNLDRAQRLTEIEAFSELVKTKQTLTEKDQDPLPGLSLNGINISKPSEDSGERRLINLTGGFFSALEDTFLPKKTLPTALQNLNSLKDHKLAVVDCLLGSAARFLEKPERRNASAIENLKDDRFLIIVRSINYFAQL